MAFFMEIFLSPSQKNSQKPQNLPAKSAKNSNEEDFGKGRPEDRPKFEKIRLVFLKQKPKRHKNGYIKSQRGIY